MKSILTKIIKSRFFLQFYFGIKNLGRKIKSGLSKEIVDYQTREVGSKVKFMGRSARINGEVTILQPESVLIGNNVHIGGGAFLDGRGGIIIGDNTHISRNLTIYTSNHNYEGERLPYDHKYIAKEVVVGKNVWIGMNVCITPGVTIGEGAIIGMGAVISKDVGEGEIVVTGGQRVINKREAGHYRSLNNEKEFGGINGEKLIEEKRNQFTISPLEAKQVVFVLSTGRSGSTTMARMFDNEPGVSAFHETFHLVIGRLSIEYQTGYIDKEEVKKKLKRLFESAPIVENETIYLESDQKLTPFIGILNEIFDNPKFIWLVRHPKTFMHSAASRGWFRESSPEFLKNRVLVDPEKEIFRTRITGTLTGEYSKEEWSKKDQRIKVLWYWRYWNSLIERGLEEISDSHKLFVRMEDLDATWSDIKDFIGLKSSGALAVKKYNSVKKEDQQKYKKEKKENYAFFEKEGFNFIKKEMSKMGYGTINPKENNTISQ